MFDYTQMFQWDRFITPSIIKPFYSLMVGLVILFSLSGVFSGLASMASFSRHTWPGWDLTSWFLSGA